MRQNLFLIGTAALLQACAAAYSPTPMNMGRLGAARDARANISTGTVGQFGGVSYGLTDALSIRGQLQAGGVLRRNRQYYLGTAGIGLQTNSDGWDLGWNLDLGGGRTVGTATISLTVNGDTTSSDFRNSGAFGRASSDFWGSYTVNDTYTVGMMLRPMYFHLLHDDQSDDAGEQAQLFATEILGTNQFGSENVKFDFSGGLSLPLLLEGSVGVPAFLVIQIGVSIKG